MNSSTPSDDDRLIDDLMVEWEVSRLEGVELSADDLAGDRPELLAPLRDRMAIMKATAWVLEDPNQEDGLGAASAGIDDQLPEALLTDEDFLQGLAETLSGSGGLDETLVSRARAAFADGETSKQLAKELVDEGVLSSFQAKVLLTRGAGPLLLDRYVLLDLIGVGGMGRVYKALHRSMERVVALKVLPANIVNSPGIAERFRREIKAAARLSHANIVAAFDAHEAGDRHFLVMEYVAGQNLFDRVNSRGPLPVTEAIKIVAQTAAALGEAHKLGVIHRDVKPSNVILSEEGVPKLLDLGIASFKETTHTEQGDLQLTQDGMPIGTVAYLSPEQARDSKDVDERTDIYSLGCTLYFLVAGRPLFDKRSAVETVAAHLSEPPPALPHGQGPPSAAVQQVFERMVAKDRDDRFASMQEVVVAFERSLLCDGSASATDAKSSWWGSLPTRAKRWLAASSLLLVAVFFVPVSRMGERKKPLQATTVAALDNEFPSPLAHLHATPQVRELTRRLLTRGATMLCTTHTGTVSIRAAEHIPAEYFEIGIIDLSRADPLGETINLLLELPELSELWIKDREIRRQAIESIAAVRSLEAIILTGTDLDDAGIESFIGMPNLKELDIGSTRVTPEAARRFRGLHPEVWISF